MQGLELNSGEQLEHFASIMSALLYAQLRLKITAAARLLLLRVEAELLQVCLPSKVQSLREIYFAVCMRSGSLIGGV